MKIVKLNLLETGDELGIDNIKLILGLVFALTEKVITLVSSIGGTFNYFAAIALLQEIIGNLGILKKWKEAINEIKNLSQAEAQELSEFFQVNFDIENDELEQRIEEGVAFIPESYALIKANIDLGARMIAWYNSWGNTTVVEMPIKKLPDTISIAA